MRMIQFWRQLFPNAIPTVLSVRIVIASLFIHTLGFASAFYVTLVFSRYSVSALDSTLITLTMGTLLAMLIEGSLRKARRRIVESLLARGERERHEKIVNHLLGGKFTELSSLGGQRTEVLRAIDQLHGVLSPANVLALVDVPFALVFLLAIFLTAWPLGILAVILILMAWGLTLFRAHELQRITTTLQKSQTDHQAVVASADRIEAVRISNAGSLISIKWINAAKKLRFERFAANLKQESIQGVTQQFAILMSIVMIGAGAKLATLGLVDFSLLFGVSILGGRMLGIAMRPAQLLLQLMQAKQSLATIDKLNGIPKEQVRGVEFQKYDGEWQFDNVSFGYSESTPPVFESVSVTAKSGDIVVVTGANGVGKTTFARLLVGLIEPIRGQVRVDGVNLLQCSASWWRKQIVYVPQEPEFFDGTLFENMTTLAPTASEENIKAVLREVGLAQLVDHHPEGLGMSITMGGKNFSLGIRRRLAIARALLTSGQLVLIDEPTEGLDAAGGQMINSVINQLKAEGRTLVICLAQASQELAQIATVIDLSEKPSPKIVRPIQNIQGLP